MNNECLSFQQKRLNQVRSLLHKLLKFKSDIKKDIKLRCLNLTNNPSLVF